MINMLKVNEKTLHLLVLVTMSLSGVVLIEPAPYDALMLALIILSLPKLIKEIVFTQSRHLMAFFIGFGLMNIIPVINVLDYRIFVKYVGVTLYLMASALWIKTYLQEKKDFNPILTGYLVAVVIAVMIGQLPSLGIKIPWFMVDDGFRVRGTFKDPNVFAPFLIPPIFLLYDRIFSKEKILKEAIIVLLLHVGLLFAFSRGAWVSYAVTGILYLAFNVKNFKKSTIVRSLKLIVIIIIVCIGMLNLTGRSEYFLSRFGVMNYDSDRFRTQMAGATGDEKYVEDVKRVTSVPQPKDITVVTKKSENKNDGNDNSKTSTYFKDNNDIINPELNIKKTPVLPKLLGLGPGQFEIYYPLSAHSLYVRTLSENGMIGFCFLAGFFLFLIGKLYLQKDMVEVARINKKTVLALLAGIAVNGIVIDVIHWRHMWLIIGIGWALIEQFTDEDRVPNSK